MKNATAKVEIRTKSDGELVASGELVRRTGDWAIVKEGARADEWPVGEASPFRMHLVGYR